MIFGALLHLASLQRLRRLERERKSGERDPKTATMLKVLHETDETTRVECDMQEHEVVLLKS